MPANFVSVWSCLFLVKAGSMMGRDILTAHQISWVHSVQCRIGMGIIQVVCSHTYIEVWFGWGLARVGGQKVMYISTTH